MLEKSFLRDSCAINLPTHPRCWYWDSHKIAIKKFSKFQENIEYFIFRSDQEEHMGALQCQKLGQDWFLGQFGPKI